MGMFDWVKIDKDLELPMPAQLVQFNLHDLEFQTKSLENCLSTYLIRKDGLFLYEEEKLVNTNFHGFIDFGSYHTTDLTDYIFDFKAKYTDGVLADIQFCRFQEFFHESREAKTKKLYEKIQKRNKKLYVRLLMLMQSVLVAFLGLLGIKVESKFLGAVSGELLSITFYHPRFIVPFLRSHKTTFNYGIMFENIDTGLNFYSSLYENCFVFKVLGLGFSIRKYKIKFLEGISKGPF